MILLVPLTITAAMVSSSTLAEPAAGETAWNAATNYTVGQRCILTATHRVYENLIAGVDATSPDQALTGTTPRWLDYSPTARWAAFDGRSSTQSALATPLTYVLRPGFFNGIAFYGLDGATLTVSIKDAPAGTVFFTSTTTLEAPYPDWYEWLFAPYRPLTKVVLSDILPYPDPEVTISITAASGTVKIGMIAIGDMRTFVGASGFGGTERGASAEPISNDYVKPDGFGGYTITRRTSATDMRARVVLDAEDADYALSCVQEVLGLPCAWIATDEPGYEGLNVFGLGSGSLAYDDPPTTAALSLNVKGLI